MAYYIRAFCKAGQVPPVRDVLDWLDSQALSVRLPDADDPALAREAKWARAAFVYGSGREPIVATCLRKEDANGEAARLIGHFVEAIGPAGRSAVKRRIVEHLKHTMFIVVLDVPAWDMDDGGWDANGQILTYMRDNCQALIQADGEGFYEGSKLVVRLDATGE